MSSLQPIIYSNTAIKSWKSTENVIVLSLNGQAIAKIPIEFIARGGDSSWGFVYDVVQQLVKQKGGSIISGKGSPMIRDHVVGSGGEYTYVVPGNLAGALHFGRRL